MDNTAYLLALHSINGLGPIRLKTVLNYFQNPRLAWVAKSDELVKLGVPKPVADLLLETRKKLDPEKYLEDIKKSGISWITIFEENYPKNLKEIYDPPTVLYFKGEILPSDEKAIGIVGTRKITGYGRLVTEKLASELAGFGLTIVSGLARGVDSAAHKAALDVGGRTLAVLGGGLNNIFPPENIDLARKISDGSGAVISEFPPDYPSLAGNFPARNRIISGLSLAILVTEAAEDSGSLITAKDALEQGRDVFAVPGPITSDLSRGPSILIKQGAKLITESTEILEELGMEINQRSKTKDQKQLALNEIEHQILDCLEHENRYVDEICRDLGQPPAAVSAALVKMEIHGLVKNLGAGNYAKIW